ncbi:MAG TPA: FAD:protein FMN transferase [Thermoanaerobaculia bacterium]|nr:FAD:protein FMN transferase [Thermoanaerobaculia bacterium]
MGTWYRVKLITERPLGVEHRGTLDTLIRLRLDTVDREMSTYRADSLVSRFNRSRPGEATSLGAATADVLKLALRVSEETDGAFDVTVAPLVDAWGFGPDGPHRPLTAEEVAPLLERVGWRLLALDGGELSKRTPGVEIDLSAIAKGYAVDLVLESVARYGQGAMVEVGGEIRVTGLNRERRPWRLAIEAPTPERRGIQRVVEATDVAIATSGDYRNFYEEAGRRYSHTIDPATGAPVTHRGASVSVLHEECALADAYATALLVMGPERGLAWARERNLPILYLVYDAEGGVSEWATPPMAELLGASLDAAGRVTAGASPSAR